MVYVSGFIGVDSYDIIHYLSRIARVLGKKSLLIDCSNNHALSHTIDNTLVPEGDIVDYRGVDFILGIQDIGIFEKYDYVFIDFGFQVKHPIISECDGIYVVTDFQRHHVAPLRDIIVDEEQTLGLIIREAVNGKVKVDAVLAQIPDLKVSEEDVYIISQAAVNTAASLSVQYDSVFRFDKITGELRNFLYSFYAEDLEDLKIKDSELKKAIKRASKGL